MIDLNYSLPPDSSIAPAKLTQPLTRSSAIATNGAVSYDVTGIFSWATEIQIAFAGISTNGSNVPMIQIGDSGGIETSGYLGGATICTDGAGNGGLNNSVGFLLVGAHAATVVFHGVALLTLQDLATNTWSFSVNTCRSDAPNHNFASGSKALSTTLDRIRLTTNSADTFDAGSFLVSYK